MTILATDKPSELFYSVGLPVGTKKRLELADGAWVKWWAFLWCKLVELCTKENCKTILQGFLFISVCYISTLYLTMFLIFFWS